MIASCQESNDKPRQCVEKQRCYSANKSPYSQGYGLPSGHAWLWELDCKDNGVLKSWCFRTMGLEKTLESLLGKKARSDQSVLREISPVYSLEGLMLKLQYFSCDVNSWLIGKVFDAGKDWGQKEKRASEDEMAGWHHQCNGHELGQSSGDGGGQGSLSCCSPLGCKELDTAGWLNSDSNHLVLGLHTLKAQSSAFKILTLLLVIAPFTISKAVLFPCY